MMAVIACVWMVHTAVLFSLKILSVYSVHIPCFFWIVDLTNKNNLIEWTPFLYVDVSESPALTVRWLQAPRSFGIPKYELKVYDKDELKRTKEFIATEEEEELSYRYREYFPTYGEYRFEVRLLNDSCRNWPYLTSQSPVIVVGKYSHW
jgi:hypothetical protein